MVGPIVRPLLPDSCGVGSGASPSESAAADRFSLSNQVLSDPSEGLYVKTVRDLLSLASPDSPQMDYWAAIQLLNDTLRIGLTRLEHNVLSLMVTGLSQTTRFRNELFLDPTHGDNSAIHSCHTAVLTSELFRRAGLLTPERQIEEVIQLRVVTTFAALMHDMGEMFGEPTTLAERQNNAALREENDFERPAFIGALRLAHWAVESHQTPEFYRKVNALRDKAKDEHGVPRLERIKDEIAALQTIKVSEEAERSIAKFLNAYDVAEAPNPSTDTPQRLFAAALVKSLERTQGTRHYLRFGTKDMRYAHIGLFFAGAGSSKHFGPVGEQALGNTIPFRYHYAPMVVKQCIRMEENLGKLWSYASTETEKALARVATDAIYALIAEFVNAGPAVYDMSTSVPQPDPFVTKCFAGFRRLPYLSPERRGIVELIRGHIYEGQALTIRELRARRNVQEGLFPTNAHATPPDGFKTRIFRRDELVAIYMRAIARRYIPTSEEPIISKIVTGFPPLLRRGPEDGLAPERKRLGELRLNAIANKLTARDWITKSSS